MKTGLTAASMPRVAAGRPRTTASEDTNGNGELDFDEDLNGNGQIDEDTGIFSVELDPGSINLVLSVDAFELGAGVVGYTVAAPDATTVGTGAIIATDGAGNTCHVPVTTPPPTPPTPPPPPPPPPPDLALSLTDIPDPLTVNGQLTYTITVTNNGGIATGVQVVDSLPPEALQPGPASSSQGECRGTVRVDCDLQTLAPGALATVTINVIPTVAGDLSNAATVFAVEPDLDDTNNSSTATTTIRPPPPDLATADLGNLCKSPRSDR